MISLPRNTILDGDAATILATLPTASVDQIVTSPPYFRLRDYGVQGQLGLEACVDGWVRNLRPVLHECARVLVPTGTLWLNLGDTYARRPHDGAPRKSLLLGPERLALLLIADGWTIRNKIIWAKTNTVPTSVRDRLATKHEVIYLLSRSPRYFFDLDAIRIPHTSRPPRPRASRTPPSRRDYLGPNSDGDRGLQRLRDHGLVGHPLGKNPGDVWPLSVSNFRGDHFATFPEKLIERIIRAGCPTQRCSVCRAPWRAPPSRTARLSPRPSCDHDAQPERGIVLDPFMGAGTTAIAAQHLHRDWLGIELNRTFRHLALDRIAAS